MLSSQVPSPQCRSHCNTTVASLSCFPRHGGHRSKGRGFSLYTDSSHDASGVCNCVAKLWWTTVDPWDLWRLPRGRYRAVDSGCRRSSLAQSYEIGPNETKIPRSQDMMKCVDSIRFRVGDTEAVSRCASHAAHDAAAHSHVLDRPDDPES